MGEIGWEIGLTPGIYLQNFDDPPMGAQVTAVELHLITGH
jgi:hypothetical protein